MHSESTVRTITREDAIASLGVSDNCGTSIDVHGLHVSFINHVTNTHTHSHGHGHGHTGGAELHSESSVGAAVPMAVVTHFAILPISAASLDPNTFSMGDPKAEYNAGRGKRRTGASQSIKRVELPSDMEDSDILGTHHHVLSCPKHARVNYYCRYSTHNDTNDRFWDEISEDDVVAVLRVVYGAPKTDDITTLMNSTSLDTA